MVLMSLSLSASMMRWKPSVSSSCASAVVASGVFAFTADSAMGSSKYSLLVLVVADDRTHGMDLAVETANGPHCRIGIREGARCGFVRCRHDTHAVGALWVEHRPEHDDLARVLARLPIEKVLLHARLLVVRHVGC